MSQTTLGESVVYGCIYDVTDAQREEHQRINNQAMQDLPSAETWSLVNREMFSVTPQPQTEDQLCTQVVHFGAAYKGVEHEWEHWLKQFEDLLRQMYWVSARVHLETELSGTHEFEFVPDAEYHDPNSPIHIRCEWVKNTQLA